MKRTFHALLLALFLTALGLSIFVHKLVSSDLSPFPNQTFTSWYVEAKISLASQPSVLSTEQELPTNIQFQLPQDSARYSIANEEFVDQGFDRKVEMDQDSVNRLATFTKAEGNNQSQFIFYRADVKRNSGFAPQEKPVSVAGRKLVDQQFLGLDENIARVEDNRQENFPDAEVIALIQEVKSRSTDRLSFVENIYKLVSEADDIRISRIRQNVRDPDSSVQTAAFLLDRAEVPVRVGNGIFLREDEVYSTDFIEWLEVQQEDQWLVFDTASQSFQAQNRYLTWWYGTEPVLQTDSRSNVDIEVVVQPNTNQGLTRSVLQRDGSQNPFLRYSFLRLPLATQRVFQILVLIPIGALIISVLHQMIGLQTFGTFTPILISLAFRQTGLATGITLFVLVVIIGLGFRGYLNRLQLLIVPRLAAILTLTVLVVGLLAIAMESLDINLGLSVSLFPIVILAMTIERASLMWEENGAKETIISGLGTILAATIGYFCMVNNYIQYWMFIFPELLLIVLAINIMVGRYNGYKLTEYFRFISLQKQLSHVER